VGGREGLGQDEELEEEAGGGEEDRQPVAARLLRNRHWRQLAAAVKARGCVLGGGFACHFALRVATADEGLFLPFNKVFSIKQIGLAFLFILK
jgi:hypothetical protein